MTTLSELVGFHIARVDAPAEGCLCFSLSAPGATCALLAAALPPRAGLFLSPSRPRGASASPSVSKVRHHFAGARITAVLRPSEHELTLEVTRGDKRALLRIATGAERWGIRTETEAGNPIAVISKPAGARTPAPALDAEVRAWLEPGHADVGARAARQGEALRSPSEGHGTAPPLDAARAAAVARTNAALRRMERRLAAVEGDLAKMSEAPALRHRAELLMAHAHALPAGATEARVEDWTNAGAVVTVHVDPALGPRRTADQLFARARRLDRGRAVAEARREETRAAVEQLREERARLEAGGPLPPGAPTGVLGTKKRAAGAVGRVPFREFVSRDGLRILVGRGAKDNDALTLHVAKPADLWLHARGQTGAHVIVPLPKGASCPAETLVDAAHLAAHFSAARGENTLEIQYAPRGRVRKPKGSAPGAVVVTEEKVLVLRLEPPRIKRLLASERGGSAGEGP